MEGCLEPNQVIAIATRNGLLDRLPFKTVAEAQAAFDYQDLQEFLDLRDATCSVLVEEQDFYEVTIAYLRKMREQNVVHVEMFFDPQVHTLRNVKFSTFMLGMRRALQEALTEFQITVKLIMCFMTELGPDAAVQTLEEALPYREDIAGVGLARGIPGWQGKRFPHSAFGEVFERCRREGFRATAHAGEEGPPSELWECINVLKVERIDHGVHCLDDPELIHHLEQSQLPLTVCPLSNLKLKVYHGTLIEKMRQLVLQTRVNVTVNSDDPPFFGAYLNENFLFWAEQLPLSHKRIYQLVRSSVQASFLEPGAKVELLARLASCYADSTAGVPLSRVLSDSPPK
ncbi:hypothetical protein WJX72_006797 [[Myrmecia] bisecta]|uniref:Adenosine deaminase domain-containing protein n=1 Tax=[Myrmecia] bisecta TaxID=41462 RepID=A0AAW1PHG0_9CHLO